MNPAQRLSGVRPSPIRVISEGASPEAIPLGLGEPSWDLPEPARRALAATVGVCAYGPNDGLVELRDAIARHHRATRDETLVTTGSEEALYALAQGWIDPGDRVLVPDPGFPAYAGVSRLAGAEVVPYPLDPNDRFRLDAAALQAVLARTERVKIVFVGSPGNPTGSAASADALRAVADACRARDVLLVVDEVYRELFVRTRPPSLRDVSDFGVVVSSVSKGWGAPGLRVGWAVGDPRWLAPARTIHRFAVTSAAVPAQRAALALLEASDQILAAARGELGARWEALAAAHQEFLGRPIGDPPDGAFYWWTPWPESARGQDPIAFALKLRDELGVVTVPGLIFGDAGRPFVRLSFAARPASIREGIRRLARWW